jgi:hypothetical protein
MTASPDPADPRSEDDLLGDPLYQVNLLIWLLQPLPPGSGFRPLLKEAGYRLESIARPLPLPPARRQQLAEAGLAASQQPGPDILAQHANGRQWLLLEAKGNSFSASSSAAVQARGLLVAGGDLTGPLGLAPSTRPDGVVAYLLPEVAAPLLATTLSQIRHELAGASIPAAPAGALGLSRQSDGVYLHDQHPAGQLPSRLERLLSAPQRVHEVDVETDPRPLYVIPWDPGIDQQSLGARYGRKVLQERIRSAAIARLGRAPIPGTVDLNCDDLLAEGTRGFYAVWRDRGQVQGLRSEVRRFLRDSLAPSGSRLPESVTPLQGSVPGWRIALQSEAERDSLLDRLHVPTPGADMTAEGLSQLELPGLFEE